MYFGQQTWSTILTFILAMTLFPGKQRKAQEEIDTIIGQSRLPEFSDRESLPYLDCLMQEVFRYDFCSQPLMNEHYYHVLDGIPLHLLVTWAFVLPR
jgi:hypothetical protein